MMAVEGSAQARAAERSSRREELLAEGPVSDGPRLVQLLRESGTGDGKLEICRAVLLKAEAEGRRASAEEVYAACAMEPARVFQGTLDKMANIIETGYWDGLVDIVPLTLVEDRIVNTPPPVPRDAGGWQPGERQDAIEAFERLLDENRRLKEQRDQAERSAGGANAVDPATRAGVSTPTPLVGQNPGPRQAGVTRPTPPGTPGMPSAAPQVTRPPRPQPRR